MHFESRVSQSLGVPVVLVPGNSRFPHFPHLPPCVRVSPACQALLIDMLQGRLASLPKAQRVPFLFIYLYLKPVQFAHGPSDQPPSVGVIIASSQPACWRLSRCCFVILSFHMNAKILNHVKHSLLPPLPPKLTKAEK